MATQLLRTEERVLVLMPSERDAERTAHLLGDANVPTTTCAGLSELSKELRAGAAAVLVTDEIVAADVDRLLEGALREQPPWSVVPVLVLARDGAAEHIHYDVLGGYNGVVVLERPVRTRSLVSAVHSALRARRNQYQMRQAIEDRERHAAELRAADKLKDEFLATLAHELRNPLAPITTGLALLAEVSDPAVRTRTLGVMDRQVRHMVRLIDDLLDVSRITRGKLELKRERVLLSSVVEAAIEGSMPNIERGQHTLRTNLPEEPLYVDADHTRLAQVISNLLNNSSRYTPTGGTIELSVSRADDGVAISVTDNGLGIPQDRLEDVFQMFGQVNRAVDRSQGGLGIGLALVRKLVDMHGGTVEATSPGPDKGSTFTVRLPLVPEGPTRSASAPPHPMRNGQSKRVLVVDDNDDAAVLLALMLQAEGYDTTTVHDGPSAIESARKAPPHIVVLDIGLPGISGYEVAAELRRDERLADTALIALTGWGSPEDRRKAMEAGFDVHLTKPVASEDLQQALARATKLRKTRASPPR